MRTPRMLILILFLAASLFLLCRSVASLVANSNRIPSDRYPDTSSRSEQKKDKGFWGFMYYNTPFSLFPPNAAISLTDDNSTSFAARPAAFGPNFNVKGLSGQLWVGSGFAEDSTDTAGELGCGDVPGWDTLGGSALLRSAAKPTDAAASDSDSEDVPDPNHFPSTRRDDARYLEEFNDIQGKIVLLMRGGCGFLEKIMWAQRRGAVAVIVGDNQRGGPLIQMFAHGEEVDNVTIPSVFTARTTAQLLSSLTQPGSFIEDTIDDYGKPMLKVRQGPVPTNRVVRDGEQDLTYAEARKRSFFVPSSGARVPRRWGWLSKLLGSREPSLPHADDIRPPSSKNTWSVDDWDDEEDSLIDDDSEAEKPIVKQENSPGRRGKGRRRKGRKHRSQAQESPTAEAPDTEPAAQEADDAAVHKIVPTGNDAIIEPAPEAEQPSHNPNKPSLLAKLFGAQTDDASSSAYLGEDDEDYSLNDIPDFTSDEKPNTHEGLWVTITPTSSASPFFDTLLVLVISPLVTLTVVYALLILRARIRRRRWRAPKSVVERLPIRTYRTVIPSPVLSPQIPASPAATPTTPLLSTASRSGPRPRSRTTTGVFDADSLFTSTPAIPTPRPSSRDGPAQQPEKGAGGFSAEWKKYMSRQVECVICLEEYVDGVSRLMTLPCGHQFHADCITPWLTNRRRTCPICKSDVVRSLAHGSPSSPRYEPYHDDDDEPDAEASNARSTDDSDLEQGIASDDRGSSRSQTRQDGWLGLLSSSFASRSQHRSRSPADRNR